MTTQVMAIISTKINDLSVKEDDCSIRERLMCDDQTPKRTSLELLNHQRKQNPQRCDVVFISGANEHRIFAHHAVLAIRVPSMQKMIEIKEGMSCVSLPDLEPFAVEALVEFAYSSKLELSPDRVWDVLSAADKMEMHEVVNKCQRYIEENMLSDCWLYARHVAVEHGFSWLLSAVDCYIAENFQAISHKTEFLQLPRLQVELINKKREDTELDKGPNELLNLVVKWCEERLQVNFNVCILLVIKDVATSHRNV